LMNKQVGELQAELETYRKAMVNIVNNNTPLWSSRGTIQTIISYRIKPVYINEIRQVLKGML